MRPALTVTVLVLLALSQAAMANVRLPAVIGDNMVLQYKTQAPIWGWAEPGEKITVQGSWDSKAVEAIAGTDGKWSVKLATLEASSTGPHTVTVKGKNEIVIKNVLLGQVWVCSGQSNMQFTLGKGQRWYTGDINEEKESRLAKYPNIRFFTVTPKYNDAPQADCNGVWKVCTPETVKTFSAVGYYFGRNLHTREGFPVGLICAAYGGTMAEAWTSREGLASEPEFAAMLAAYDKDKVTFAVQRKAYDQEQAAWAAEKAAAEAEGKTFTKAAPKKPVRVPNQNSPTVLWNAMVNPIVPFAMKGVIWYQGESNDLDKRSWEYTRLFPLMVASWRKDWQQGEFPFYFVQIAPYKDMSPEIREAQRLSMARIPNSGMVVTTDVGNCNDIHPRDKGPVGERLARWALAKTYHLNVKAAVHDTVHDGKGVDWDKVSPSFDYISGPMYKEMKVEDGKVRLIFDYADSGLKGRADDVSGFTIAGKDQKFVPAKAKVEGKTVVVWSDEVKEPAAVRFGWNACPEATLFNGAGLPASPFKTDDWKWESVGGVKKAG
jgi:sialate O-acetylesterase